MSLKLIRGYFSYFTAQIVLHMLIYCEIKMKYVKILQVDENFSLSADGLLWPSHVLFMSDGRFKIWNESSDVVIIKLKYIQNGIVILE